MSKHYNTNVCIFTGNVTRDPAISFTQGQEIIAKISLAVNHGDKASFFDFTAFKKTAEIIQMYVKKGAKLCILSRAHQESWMDKTTGVNRHAVRGGDNGFHALIPPGGLIVANSAERGNPRRRPMAPREIA